MDKLSKQKIHKETMALNDTLNQMDLADILRAFHPKAAGYTFFSSAHGTFSRIDHTLGHQSSLKKYKKKKKKKYKRSRSYHAYYQTTMP